MANVECKRCAEVTGNYCLGPCFDYCMCGHCWRGWGGKRSDGSRWGLPFMTMLWWRIQYIWKELWRYPNISGDNNL